MYVASTFTTAPVRLHARMPKTPLLCAIPFLAGADADAGAPSIPPHEGPTPKCPTPSCKFHTVDCKASIKFTKSVLVLVCDVLAGVPLSLNSLSLLKWKDESGEEQTLQLIEKVSCKWLDFGLKVGLEMNCLEAWERQHHEDASRCWLEVMKCWLNMAGSRHYPATWEGLYQLLMDVGYKKVAKDLSTALASFPHH